MVKWYGTVPALQGLSLSVQAGELVAITGPSGSGKSTLLNLIGTLDAPDGGSILLDGRPLPPPRSAVEFRRHTVGFVFQDNLLLPYLSAMANVEAALLAPGVGILSLKGTRGERRRRSEQLLSEVGLSARAHHLPAALSAGERQRVTLARALANEPRLLLADEPTGALDSRSSERVLELLAELRRRHGMTMLIATHDATVTARADREVRVVDGRVEE